MPRSVIAVRCFSSPMFLKNELAVLLLFLLLLGATVFGNEDADRWVPENVPENSLAEFLDYYQQYLHYQKKLPGRDDDDKAESKAQRLKSKREDQRERAVLCERLGEVLADLARAPELRPSVDGLVDSDGKELKKEPKYKISQTWNLYKNIPFNAADLWQEACFLKLRALMHLLDAESLEAELLALEFPDSAPPDWEPRLRALDSINAYAADLRSYERLQPLYLAIKRTWYGRSLGLIEQQRKAITEKQSKEPISNELESSTVESNAVGSDAAEFGPLKTELAKVVFDYQAFLPDRLSLKEAELGEAMIDSALRLHAPETLDRLGSVLEAAIRQAATFKESPEKSHLLELLETERGMIRRSRLLGKEMPIWGILLDRDRSGKALDPAALEGKVVLLDFWATWCGPCVAEFPHLKKLYEKYHEKGFEIIGYNVDSDWEKAYSYLQERPLPWPVLSKELSLPMTSVPMPLSTYYGAKRIPVVLLRDREGKTVLIEAKGQELDAKLEQLFRRDVEPH